MTGKWVAGCLLIGLTFGVSAQQGPESVLIAPGDLIHVQVFDTPEAEQHIRVTDAGSIPLIIGGSVKVAGLTPGEAALAIQKVLIDEHLMLRPNVSVSMEEGQSQKVSVFGEVKVPGAYSIESPRSVVEVLTLAGGLSDFADRKLLIERHGTSEKIPYFVSNQPGSAFDTAVKINPGDSIIVPRAGLVYALGDLRVPGGYTMTTNDGQLSVLQLVARAGGSNHTASEAHAKLIRKSEQGYVEIALPLKDMLKGKRPDVTMQADDILFVPFSYMRNLVLTGSTIVSATGSAAIYHF